MQKSHQIKGKSLDVKKAISKQDMDRRHDQGRMNSGYGSFGGGGGGYSESIMRELHVHINREKSNFLPSFHMNQITGIAAIRTAAAAVGIAAMVVAIGVIIGTTAIVTRGIPPGRVKIMAGRIAVIMVG